MAKQKKKGLLSVGTIRLLTQCVVACLCNGYLKGLLHGKIYTGKLKVLCVPGMNCYSCPGALGACPMGSLQSALAANQYRSVLYVLGFLTVFGTLCGRMVCGFLCPFGLVQDLIYRIPFFKKIKRLPGERALRLLRVLLLVGFVVLLPLFAVDAFGLSDPWFCKYVCPVGTLEAGIPLVLSNPSLQAAVGWLYAWKLVILGVILALSLLLYRPFCRYLCPLGLLYGFFNRFALYRYQIDEIACIHCGQCQESCPMQIDVLKNPNSIDCVRCGRCLDACPTGAIRSSLTSCLKKEK